MRSPLEPFYFWADAWADWEGWFLGPCREYDIEEGIIYEYETGLVWRDGEAALAFHDLTPGWSEPGYPRELIFALGRRWNLVEENLEFDGFFKAHGESVRVSDEGRWFFEIWLDEDLQVPRVVLKLGTFGARAFHPLPRRVIGSSPHGIPASVWEKMVQEYQTKRPAGKGSAAGRKDGIKTKL